MSFHRWHEDDIKTIDFYHDFGSGHGDDSSASAHLPGDQGPIWGVDGILFGPYSREYTKGIKVLSRFFWAL